MVRFETTTSNIPRPRFARHTQSSLMKTRTPIKLKNSSLKDVSEPKRSLGAVILRSSIHKKRHSITKQNRSLQMMFVVLKQQNCRATIFYPDTELMKTTCPVKKSFNLLQNDLIKDISFDLKKSTGSPVKLETKVTDKSEKHVENLPTSFQDKIYCVEKNNDNYGVEEDNLVKSVCVLAEDHKPIDVACKFQLCLDDEEPEDSGCKIEVFHRTESEEKPDNSLNEGCSQLDTQVQLPNVNAVTNRSYKRKWYYKKKKVETEHEQVGHAYRDSSHDFKNAKHVKKLNEDENVHKNEIRKKNTFRKNFTFNNRACRPPGVLKTCNTESGTSLLAVSKKSSQLVKKCLVSSKSKHSLTEHVDASNNKSTGTLQAASKSKTIMKENRDPRANPMTKIDEKSAKTNKKQKQQSGKTLSKSKLRNSQTQLMPKRFSNNPDIEQNSAFIQACNKTTETLKVMHTVGKINDSVKGDENAKKNTIKRDFDYKQINKKIKKIQTFLDTDLFSESNESHIFLEDINLCRINQSSQRSIGTQIEPDFVFYEQIDKKKTNLVDIGCNTSFVNNDVQVSYDLLDFTEINPVVIENKLTINPINSELSSVNNTKMNIKSEDGNKNSELSNEILNKDIKFTNPNNEANTDIDRHQESTKSFNDHGTNSLAVETLFLPKSGPLVYDYETSCSSEDVMEYLENDVHNEDAIVWELKRNNVLSDTITTLELAAERARNIYKAFVICRENSMSKDSGGQDKGMIQDYETSKSHDTQQCLGTCDSFINCENCIKSTTICHFVGKEDFSQFSTCSSKSSSVSTCEFENKDLLHSYMPQNCELDQKEAGATFSENDQAIMKSSLNDFSDRKDVKSLMQLVPRSPENYALELFLDCESNENFETEGATSKTLALSATIDKTYLLTYDNLIPFFYCVVCTVVFWFLQSLIQCNSEK